MPEDNDARGTSKRRAKEKKVPQPPAAGKSAGLNFPVVGIGASAGGMEALKRLFENSGAEIGMSFIVVQHLDPARESRMAELLDRVTSLRVLQAEDSMEVEPDSVYIIPPGRFLSLESGRLKLSAPATDGPRMSIDYLFRSLAAQLQDKAICVILSGSASDGALGMRDVRGAGGLAVVQDPETAQFDSMPRNAIATGLVDFVLPPEEIIPAITNYVRHAYVKPDVEEEKPTGTVADGLEEILRLLLRADHDFRGYKSSTLLRRIYRRMGVRRISNLGEYVDFLRKNPGELPRLGKDIVISVTGFFRDPDAWETWREEAVKPVVENLPEDRAVRAWVAGCSTGEEAYSMAILILEEIRAANKANPVQIFASDIDGESLAAARTGVYPESIATDVSPERLQRFFLKRDHGYKIREEVRDTVVFSAHNLITHPPFTRMDLMTCRNVLIYLGDALQERLVSMLAFSLNQGGYLLLGPAESLGSKGDAFDVVNKKWRIFRRNEKAKHELIEFPHLPQPAPVVPTGETREKAAQVPLNAAVVAQRALVEHFDAALVLVDEKGNVIYFQGDTHKYLRHPTGGADLNLFHMARGPLPGRLRAGIRQALSTGEPVEVETTSLGVDGRALIEVTISPVENGRREKVLAIIFQEVPGATQARATAIDTDSQAYQVVEQLESELEATRERLSISASEHAAANEELRAAHEEAISMNEELRSTNEELETSKEELQSVNEELNTLNAELREKIQALNEVNSDLSNLMEATGIATLFLDRELCLRRYTPTATQLLHLIPGDIGRPVDHLSQRFNSTRIGEIARQVLSNLSATQSEVRTPEDRWYLLNALPYRDSAAEIDGVVITFTEITQLKLAEQDHRRARCYSEGLVATAREPFVVLDEGFRIVSANPAFYRAFHLQPDGIEGKALIEISGGCWDIPDLVVKLKTAFANEQSFEGFEIKQDFPDVGERIFILNATPMNLDKPLVLLAMEDITEERRRRQLAETMASEVSHRTKNGLAIVAGLLDMQLDHKELNERDRELISGTIARIRSFVALYDLFCASDSEKIELSEMLRRIGEVTKTTLAAGPTEFAVESPPVTFDLKAGTNLAVVASELIMNAIKHGAPEDSGTRRVKIAVYRKNSDIVLTVWSSGNPIAKDFRIADKEAMGLHLINSLILDYYDGDFRLEPLNGGTMATVILPEEALRADQLGLETS